MYVILSEDDSSTQEMISSLGCAGQFDDDLSKEANTGWIRVARLRLDGKSFAGVDIVFVPLLLGQIDHGTFVRIS